MKTPKAKYTPIDVLGWERCIECGVFKGNWHKKWCKYSHRKEVKV